MPEGGFFRLWVVLKILIKIFKYFDGRFAPSRKRLSASNLSHIARYAPSFTYKNTLPIRHKSTHQNY